MGIFWEEFPRSCCLFFPKLPERKLLVPTHWFLSWFFPQVKIAFPLAKVASWSRLTQDPWQMKGIQKLWAYLLHQLFWLDCWWAKTQDRNVKALIVKLWTRDPCEALGLLEGSLQDRASLQDPLSLQRKGRELGKRWGKQLASNKDYFSPLRVFLVIKITRGDSWVPLAADMWGSCHNEEGIPWLWQPCLELSPPTSPLCPLV